LLIVARLSFSSSSFSYVTLGLAGVMAGVAVGPLNENPLSRKVVQLLIDKAAGDDDAAIPNENLQAPIPASQIIAVVTVSLCLGWCGIVPCSHEWFGARTIKSRPK
jgi:hypothetical protein